MKIWANISGWVKFMTKAKNPAEAVTPISPEAKTLLYELNQISLPREVEKQNQKVVVQKFPLIFQKFLDL